MCGRWPAMKMFNQEKCSYFPHIRGKTEISVFYSRVKTVCSTLYQYLFTKEYNQSVGSLPWPSRTPYLADTDVECLLVKLLNTNTFQGEDAEHMLTIIHDITTNNIGSLCYHNTYKYVADRDNLVKINNYFDQVYQVPHWYRNIQEQQGEGRTCQRFFNGFGNLRR